MKTQILISSFALILVAIGFGLPAEGKEPFELFPLRSETDPKQLRIMSEYFEGLEAVEPIPKTHGCVARLIVYADKGDLDISLCDPIVLGGTEKKRLFVVRVRERLDAAFGAKRGWCVTVDSDFGNDLCQLTRDVLGRTSYASGLAAVAGLGSQFDFSSSLLAGSCFNPPKDSHVGKLAEIWIRLAEWCSMDEAIRAKENPLVEEVKDLRRIVDGLDATLVIPKLNEMFDDNGAAEQEVVSGNQAIERLLSKKGEEKSE